MEFKYFILFIFLCVTLLIFSFAVRRIDEESFYMKRKMASSPDTNSKRSSMFDIKKLEKLIGMAGFSMTIERLYIYKVIAAAVCANLAIIAMGNVTFALPAAVGGFFIPNLWLRSRKSKRQNEMLSQLPETLERMANYMKAGTSLTTAIERTSENSMEPTKTELLHILADIRKGATAAESMSRADAERITIPEFKMVSLATAIHADIGGDMPETYENIAKTIKDKKDLIETIRVSTTESRLSGWIVGSVPVAAFFLLKLVNPEFINAAMKEPIANVLYVFTFVWDALGLILMRKMSDVSKEVRDEG